MRTKKKHRQRAPPLRVRSKVCGTKDRRDERLLFEQKHPRSVIDERRQTLARHRRYAKTRRIATSSRQM